MFPDFLKPFEEKLNQYKRESIKISAKPQKENNYKDSLELKQSKLLGTPFFPKDKVYPTDDEGKPMIMIAQINFSECPTLLDFPEDGILQLFVSDEYWDMGSSEIIYHNSSDLKKEANSDFSFLENVDFEDIPIYKVHSLTFEKAIEYGGSGDAQFDLDFNGKAYWDFYEELNDKQKEQMLEVLSASGHKIGGYAEFTQYDPREYDPNKQNDVQLLQIDVDEEIMFGDCGIAHIFIKKEALAKKQFDDAYFYWDCC